MLIPPNVPSISGPPVERSALEYDFPIVEVSKLAEAESWRKEVHRPASHTHKWWARRLGSVVRAAVIAAYSDSAAITLERIGSGLDLSGVSLLDPFAGSGTTLVEAAKLGTECTGVDINPVACFVQRQALQPWSESRLHALMGRLERKCRPVIDMLYADSAGDPVLYYFWVAQASCDLCREKVDLFSSFVFARHASRSHLARAICPECQSVESVDLSGGLRACSNGHDMNRPAPVTGQNFVCSKGHTSRIISALNGTRPSYRMYAKIVLRNGRKVYERIDEFDRKLYEEASRRRRLSGGLLAPLGTLSDGYNTRQAMRWGFTSWRDFFNERQLYSLGFIGAAIRDLPESAEREALCALFSGTLEFNNLFSSFKGEGTGAVRHMFSHHILRPERTPLEAHPWGTPKSSGAFSTLFRSRILRAASYKSDPHDLVFGKQGRPERRHGLSRPLAGSDRPAWKIIAGDSAHLDIPNNTFDLVVTDPPYFDQVHYSELADFFHAWLTGIRPHSEYDAGSGSTRSEWEVQSTSVDRFEEMLSRVFREVSRVMKDDGLLVFSFHHMSSAAWLAVADALRSSCMAVTAIQPVKAEMSTSAAKSKARQPNTLDSLVVCRSWTWLGQHSAVVAGSPQEACGTAISKLDALRKGDIRVGVADVRSVVTGSVMAIGTLPRFTGKMTLLQREAERLADRSCAEWRA